MPGHVGGRCVLLGLLVSACLQRNPEWDAELLATSTGVVASTSTTATSVVDSLDTAPESTMPDTSMADVTTDVEDPTTSGASESGTTGLQFERFEITFGDRTDADVQGTGQDTYIRINAPTQNAGIHEDVHVSTDVAVSLLQWDITAIPPEATIAGVVLRVATWMAFAAEVTAYPVLEPWQEGAFNEQDGAPNWYDRADGVPWTAEGVGPGSRSDDVVGIYDSKDPSDVLIIELDPDLVQAWLDDPDNNFGIVLVASGTTDGWVVSRDYPIAATRPLLTVEYDLPVMPD